MKVKVGTQLDEEVLQALKVRAAAARIPMAEIIQDAVSRYLKDDRRSNQRRDSLLRIFNNPARIPDRDFAEILEADYYEQ